ncbi:MAG: 30S ribosome-binding factor RbfA [Clostridia bacterium]|nr:30S ribosome-binding factor RbfA [Clostridia bacterium]
MRTERVDEDIKYYIDKILRENLSKYTNEGIITVTSVKTTKDLRYSKVYVSIFGTKYTHQVFDRLVKNAGFVRKNLASMLKARNIPDIVFELDDSMEYGSKMERIINEVSAKDRLNKKEAEENIEE